MLQSGDENQGCALMGDRSRKTEHDAAMARKAMTYKVITRISHPLWLQLKCHTPEDSLPHPFPMPEPSSGSQLSQRDFQLYSQHS